MPPEAETPNSLLFQHPKNAQLLSEAELPQGLCWTWSRMHHRCMCEGGELWALPPVSQVLLTNSILSPQRQWWVGEAQS